MTFKNEGLALSSLVLIQRIDVCGTFAKGGQMSTPVPRVLSNDEIIQELANIEKEMQPYNVEVLRRLRDAGALKFDEERLLERHEALSWMLNG